DTLEVLPGGFIFAAAGGSGDAGKITVKANSIRIDNQNNDFGAGIGFQPENRFTGGRSGSVLLESGMLQILGGGAILTDTLGPAASGSIDIRAESVEIDGEGFANFATGVSATSVAANGGRAGDISVRAKTLKITNGGFLSASTLGS